MSFVYLFYLLFFLGNAPTYNTVITELFADFLSNPNL
jgi:hypothetical protein